LDGRPVRAPSRQPLRLPTRALAEAVAAEWAAQGEDLRPDDMPITQYANTAHDQVVPNPDRIVAALLEFVDGDVLCYREPKQTDLSRHQQDHWQPLLDWAAGVLGVELAVTYSLMPLRQPIRVTTALDGALKAMDPWALTGLQGAAAASGSLILGLALAHGRVDSETCFTLSRLDETWQMRRWGEDEETRAGRAAVRRDLAAAETLIRLSRPDEA